MAGDWFPVRTMKKMMRETGNSGDIIDLRTYSGGVPWNNPQILVSFFGYLPDLTKYRYYTKVESLGNDKYKLYCECIGFQYSDSYLVGNVACSDVIGATNVLFSGNYYGASFEYNASYGSPPYKGTAGQDAYASGTLFNSVWTSNAPNPLEYVAFYSANTFTDYQRTGTISVVNTRKTTGGIFQNIRIFPTASTIVSGLPIQWVAVEGDY